MPYIPLMSNLPGVSVGTWKIEEDELYFLERVKLYQHEWARLAAIVHPQKRLEWLSSRLCLKELIKISDRVLVESLNTQTGKPYLSDHSHFISYTHSTEYSAAIASQLYEVGIDIEYRHRNRNTRTRFLFMNEQELAWYHAQESKELFLMIWSAKETLYKMHGRGYTFKHDIALNLENFSLEQNGKFSALVQKDDVSNSYEVSYHLHPDFILTYCARM
ncbi:MAG: 4'-phosphopantetheinyl transferase superfamily protein [Bacteroidia bacterium]|nr:4'-phosphopantetheinyl transferase superfamily protein [Bacteroidia bacterium]